MDMDNIFIKMVILTKDSLKMGTNRDQDNWSKNVQRIKPIKDILDKTWNGVMELLRGILEVVTKDFLKETNDMDMEKCFGQMEIFIEAGGKRDFNMGKANYLFRNRD